jgi:hypothetical protein
MVATELHTSTPNPTTHCTWFSRWSSRHWQNSAVGPSSTLSLGAG